MKALVTEGIGTFFLVLTYGLTVNQNAALAGLSIGMILMVMVYAGGPVSGAHYNPAVSLGLTITGALPRKRLLHYWAAQFAGSILAGVLVWKFTGEPTHVEPDDGVTIMKALTGEFIATFALAYVVMHVATGKGREGNSYFGLAIGATVASLAVAIGPMTGGAFNPALGFGSAIVEMLARTDVTKDAWIYLVGPLAGASVAALAFRYQESGAS